ncbi:MAG: phosphatidate cytidylyltransferase [Candidatus Omnitrophota bacterium]
MRKRVITSSILIILTIVSIFILPVWTFGIICSLFIGLGLSEFFKLDSNNIFPRSFIILGVIAGMLLPYMTYVCDPQGGIWEAVFFIFLVIILFLAQFTRKDNTQAVALIALTLFGVFYIGWLFTFLVKIRNLQDGHKLVAYLLLVSKTGDIGAYLVGSKFGKHSLIPRISPKKSVEGAIGGFLCSIVFALISRSYLGRFSFQEILISGILIGVFSQLGDLAESLVKRNYHVKDSSPFLPGLGGMLDVIDSILFSAPIFYIYLIFIS